MIGAGFIGHAPGRRRGKSGAVTSVLITANLSPASSDLSAGQALQDTASWSTILGTGNYATTAAGQSIASVVVNYIGDTGSATEVLAGGDTINFAVTVTDTAGNTRVFAVIPRVAAYAAPGLGSAFQDQSFIALTGVQTYDVSGGFTGADLIFAVTDVPGISMMPVSGVISFDTDLLAVQSGSTITVTATNAGGTISADFMLDITAPVVYGAQITGLTVNVTHGPSAQIGVPVTGSISGLQGGEAITHGWQANGSFIAGALGALYVPVSGLDLASLRYAPVVNGQTPVSPAATVRYAPPTAGTLLPVTAQQGGGNIEISLLAGFTGQNLSYSSDQPWATVSGSTLSLADEARSETVKITATNSGGSAEVDLPVTITAPVVVSLISPIADQSIVQNAGDVTVDLSTVFANATSYAVAGAGASIDGDGVTLRLDDGTEQAGQVITVTGTNATSSAQDVFTLTVSAAATVPAQMAAPTVAADGPTQVTVTLAAAPSDGGAPLTEFDLRSRVNGGSWSVQQDVTGPVVLSGLFEQNLVEVQTRAENSIGAGLWSATASVITPLAAPVAANGLLDQTFDQNSGVQTYDVSGDFTGAGVFFAVTALAGVSIDPATGVLSFDTDVLAAPASPQITVTATNSSGSASSGFTLTLTETAFNATLSGDDLLLANLPDVSAQTFEVTQIGSDVRITFTAPFFTPVPTRLAVIEAANHDGSAPVAGSYDVDVFDLGTPQGNSYTLANTTVSLDALFVLLDAQTDVIGGGFSEFERVVFIGASIMEQTFGSDFSLRNAAAEAAFAAQGAQVEVYANAASGSTAAQVQPLLAQAMAQFPDKTLFFVHAGGNDVTANTPYPGGEAALTTGLNALIDTAAARPGSVILSDLSFRDYNDTTAAAENNGAKAYNDALYLPLFQARMGDLLARAYYPDGTPVSCLYEWSYANRATYLSADNIHPANPVGRDLLTQWLAARLAPICLGQAAPPQEDRTTLGGSAPQGAVDLFIEYGVQTAAGVNTPNFARTPAAGQTSDGPFALLNQDDSDSGVTLTLTFSQPASGGGSDMGLNFAGRLDGPTGFDGTLYNDIFTGDSFFARSTWSVDHVLAGLQPNTGYTVALIASRNAAPSRETLYSFANGETATIETTDNPVAQPVLVTTQSDGSGTITITQSAITGSWSYLGGLHIFET